MKQNSGVVIARIEDVAEHDRNSPAPDRKHAAVPIGKAARANDVARRHAAFAALTKMRHKGSSKDRKRWLNPPAKKVKPAHIEAINAAGMIADKGSLRTMLRFSDHKQTTVAVAASTALGGLATLPVAEFAREQGLGQRSERATDDRPGCGPAAQFPASCDPKRTPRTHRRADPLRGRVGWLVAPGEKGQEPFRLTGAIVS